MHHPRGGQIADRQAIQIGDQAGHPGVMTEQYRTTDSMIQFSDKFLQLGGTGMVKIFASLNLIWRKTDLLSHDLSRGNCTERGAAYPNIGADAPPLQAFAHLGSVS